jgi:quercetin dioxygenase-like cupin family protein
MIVRLYTGDDGQARFEDLNVPSGNIETVALKAGADMTFRSAPDGDFQDWHNGPRRQYVIVLSGKMEIGIGDGTTRTFEPGDILQVEDLTGQGHTTRAVGGPRVSASIPLPG